MPRRPIWSIFILMSASIVTAAAYHAWLLSRVQGHSPASFVASRPRLPARLAVENDCSPDRLYLEKEISRMAPIFRESRWRRTQDFPKECVVTGVVLAKKVSGEVKHQWCSEKGMVDAPSPCASETFVNVVDNAIADVTDCFEIAPRDFLVVAAERAALEINCANESQERLLDLRAMATIQASEKISCQRTQLLMNMQVLPHMKGAQAEACGTLKTPFLPLVQLASHLRSLQDEFDESWAKHDERWTLGENERLQLRGLTYFLAAEIGVGKAVDLMDGFLRARLKDEPARRLSSEGAPAEELLNQFHEFLQSKLGSRNLQAFSRVANWRNVMFSQSLHNQCLPDSLAIQ